MLSLVFCVLHVQVGAQNYTQGGNTLVRPKVYVNAGYYFPNVSTQIRVDSEAGIGTDISLEDDLKLDANLSVFKAGALVRLRNKSQLDISYTSFKRNKSVALARDIDFGDTTFYVGARADVQFDVSYYALTWRYSFFNEPNWNAGLSLGARGVQIKAALGAQVHSTAYAREARATAPALLLGVHGAGYLTPRLLARYRLEYFYLSVSGLDITVLENDASLQYFITENIGVGGSYNSNGYRLRDIPLNESFDGKVIFAFGGFNLFVTARF